ncbi:MAG: serine protease Do, partial [Clostridiales bacterium]|nr:serine protease Do [Clostridiales bacterium]
MDEKQFDEGYEPEAFDEVMSAEAEVKPADSVQAEMKPENGVAEPSVYRAQTQPAEERDTYAEPPVYNAPYNGGNAQYGGGNGQPPKAEPKKQMPWKRIGVAILVVVLIGASTFSIGYYQGQINISEAALNEKVNELLASNFNDQINQSVVAYLNSQDTLPETTSNDISKIYDLVSSSVVGITSQMTYYDFFNVARTADGSGSGVIIDQTDDLLYIVTNYHVVDGATDVSVDVSDGVMVTGTLVGYDEDTDIAVLSIQKSDVPELLLNTLNPIEVGDSDLIAVGELAVAIGNPLGYSNTLTSGVISAVDRTVQDDSDIKYIQTDAAINPGNSGGALVNSLGQLIGINTAKIADTEVEGMGFSIPSNTIMPIVDELIQNGYVARPFIGIGGVNIDEASSELYEIPVGVLIQYVYEGSPAETAGLQKNDLIIGVDDVTVYNMDDLTGYISAMKPGDQINLKILRDGDTKMVVSITLGN